jgi:hypothetical protein
MPARRRAQPTDIASPSAADPRSRHALRYPDADIAKPRHTAWNAPTARAAARTGAAPVRPITKATTSAAPASVQVDASGGATRLSSGSIPEAPSICRVGTTSTTASADRGADRAVPIAIPYAATVTVYARPCSWSPPPSPAQRPRRTYAIPAAGSRYGRRRERSRGCMPSR